MKDRRGGGGGGGGDRMAVFPFSIGCMSQSAVSVVDHQEKKPQNNPSTTQSAEEGGGGGDKVKGALTSPGIVAAGMQRLIKGLKSLSHMFVMYDEEEEVEEREMVIGYPTDVQHVGHIGWDGLNKVGDMVNAFSLPSSLSLRQLEMAMETHA